MRAITLWSAGNKPERLGIITVSTLNGVPAELIEWKGKQFIRAYYGGWCYDELPASMKV